MANYPWDKCIEDMRKRYGSIETARRVCGKIRAEAHGRSIALGNDDEVKDDYIILLPDGYDLLKALLDIEAELGIEPVAEGKTVSLEAYEDEGIAAPDPVKTYPLKALGDGWVEGPAVVFSPGGDVRDAVGDYFERDTDFGWEGSETRAAMYQHGQDGTLGKKLLGVDAKGWFKDRIDDVALWVKHQLDLRDEWEKAIYELVEMGKMGLSSGTAQHALVRWDNGKLVRWPIVEISYTPTPAEPRTFAARLSFL